MAIEWITYKSKQILYINYSGNNNEEELLKILYEAIEIERNSNDKILELCDFNNMYITKKFNDEIQRLGKEVSSHKVEKTAVLGISGIKKILYKAYILFSQEKQIKLFDDLNEAKEWLVL